MDSSAFVDPSSQSLSQPCLPTIDPGPTKILPFLYLGSQKDAMNQALLEAHNITYELNVSATCPKPEFVQDSHFKRIPVNDSYTERLLPYFPIAFEFLEKVRKSDECALVHCLAGISRSATVVIAYLMQHSKLTLDDAYRYVKSKRATISPNFHFLGQLLEYEERIRKEWLNEPVKIETSLLSPVPKKQVTSGGQKKFCSAFSIPSSPSCATLSSFASPSGRFSTLPSTPSPSSPSTRSSRNMSLKLSPKTCRIAESSEDYKPSADQSPTATLAKLSFSSSSQSGYPFEIRERPKQRPIEEIISSCPKAGRRFVSDYCSSLTVHVGDAPNVKSFISTATVSRTVEKRRAESSSSFISFDLPLRSYTSTVSSVIGSDNDVPTQAKTSRIEEGVKLPLSLPSSSAKLLKSQETSNENQSCPFSSENFKLGSLQMPWRKKEAKSKPTSKWYVGLEKNDFKKCIALPLEKGVVRTDSCSSDASQRSSLTSSSNLASEFSDTSTECSSIVGDKENEPVKLRTRLIERKFNLSAASQDSAYVSMIIEPGKGTFTQPETVEEKKVTSPDHSHEIQVTPMEPSGTKSFQRNLSELESSHDSGIQGSISSWSSSFTSSILASSLNTSFCRGSDKDGEEELEDPQMQVESLYRSDSCPEVDDGLFSLPKKEKTNRASEESNQANDTDLAKPSSDTKLRTLGAIKWCNCSLGQRNRRSLDITYLISVQSSESALKSSGISYESCPDILGSNYYNLSRSRSVCSQCSKIKRGFASKRPSSVSGRLYKSGRSSPESPNHNSPFTSQKLIYVS